MRMPRLAGPLPRLTSVTGAVQSWEKHLMPLEAKARPDAVATLFVLAPASSVVEDAWDRRTDVKDHTSPCLASTCAAELGRKTPKPGGRERAKRMASARCLVQCLPGS